MPQRMIAKIIVATTEFLISMKMSFIIRIGERTRLACCIWRPRRMPVGDNWDCPEGLDEASKPAREGACAPRTLRKKSVGSRSCEVHRSNNHVDQFDSDKRKHDSSETVDQQVALQNLGRAERPEFYAPQRQGNERDDDERIKNNGAQDRAG